MTDIPKEKKSHALRTGIIVSLATILTTVSLAMITVSAWERSATLLEAILVALLSGSVALSAHLLPALVKKRVGKFSGTMVILIWIVAVSITLYSHTVFFVTNMTQSGENRAENSDQVKDISKMATATEDMAKDSNARSKVDITRDIANNDIQLQSYIARRCKNPTSTSRCKAVESGIEALKSKQNALNVELQEANRVAGLKEKAMQMQQEAMKVKNDKRLDPVTEKLSLVFNGLNVDAITLIISVVNAALLEMLASLFWWLVWPGKTEDELIKDAKFESKLNRRSQSLKNNKVDGQLQNDAINNLKLEEKSEEIETLLLNKNIVKSALPIIKEGKIVYKQGYFDKTEEDLFISQYIQRIIMSTPEKYIQRNKNNIITEDIAIMSYVKRIEVILIPIEKEKRSVEEIYNEIENKQKLEIIEEEEQITEEEFNTPLNNSFFNESFENDSDISIPLFELAPEETSNEVEEVIDIISKENVKETEVLNNSENLIIADFVTKLIIEDEGEKEEEFSEILEDNIVEQKVVNSRFAHLKDNSLIKHDNIEDNNKKSQHTIMRSVPTNTDKLPMENSMSKINTAFNRKVVEEVPVIEKLIFEDENEEDLMQKKSPPDLELRKWGKFVEDKKDSDIKDKNIDKDVEQIINLFDQ